MKLYIAGPMSGIPQMNFPAFDNAATLLRSDGHEVVTPSELDSPRERKLALASEDGIMPEDAEASWGELLGRDLKIIADEGIDQIVVLNGWEKSKGARLETFVGRLMGLPIVAYPSLNPIEQYTLECVHALNPSPLVKSSVSAPVSAPRLEDIAKDFPPLDTAESVQSDAEVECKSFETRRVDPVTGGEKGVKDEVEGDLCPKALIQLAKVCGFGRKKYSRANYLKGYEWSSSYDAMQRHLKAFWAGEEINRESGLHHLAHGAWHALALLAFTIRKIGTDDRCLT